MKIQIICRGSKRKRKSAVGAPFISALILAVVGGVCLGSGAADAKMHHARQAAPSVAVLQTEAPTAKPSEIYFRRLDELSALWSFYKRSQIEEGRVISHDEGGITTSEGQGYALLRAVWENDRDEFRKVWRWTRDHLQIRGEDRLFAWKWKGRVLDRNSATDADTDIALALLMASHRFSEPEYRDRALEVLGDLWSREIVEAGDGKFYVTAGNWAPGEAEPTIHLAYLAPYAYSFFAEEDSRYPWHRLVESSYRVLHWVFDEKGLQFPPEKIYLEKGSGKLKLEEPRSGKIAPFSYDAFPIYWRVALDATWYARAQGALRRRMLEPLRREWKEEDHRLFDRYEVGGQALSRLEALPLYATVHSLARIEDTRLAEEILAERLNPLWQKALSGGSLPYYLQNWLAFDRALELNQARTYTEFLGFLRPFDFESFSLNFPWLLFGVTLALYLFRRFGRWPKLAFLALAFVLCGRYLAWRLGNSLNFLEGAGPVISIALWMAEAYCFSTVLLLVVQVGLSGGRRGPEKPKAPAGFCPSVDVFIPIYSESLEILEKTLIAARAMRYPRKTLHVCDDSHRESVREMAGRFGAVYFKGPKKHAKAGNLNQAIARTSGELLLIFDTDHIPVSSFLEETVPWFSDEGIGFVQTPHHFYNEDIFQRAFGTGTERVPDEQDMFNHAIQSGRHHWNGSFFVGSGALFRRKAIEALGGFKLMSITEDIHTSQHLHAAGWRSAFVDRDLAVGLTAENLASFIVQRKRWMQGCLQIFFKDNPLFCRGLSIRQRVGYFASLYYFFYPVARAIFWATPLLYLLFHWHPIFAEVSVLVAYLLPYMLLLPLISSVLLPGWPRVGWGVAYEMVCAFALLRSMVDVVLPRSLAFKVTPKGLRSEKRSFDVESSKSNLVVTAITLFAIGKGLFEFHAYGIEKDAYFFNIAWATVNLFFLGVSLLVAWEKPQRRSEDRIKKTLSCTLEGPGGERLETRTRDVSLGGFSIEALLEKRNEAGGSLGFPVFHQVMLAELENPQGPRLRARVERVHRAKAGLKKSRMGFRFVGLDASGREALLLMTFASASTWRNAHERRVRTQFGMCAAFLRGVALSLKIERSSFKKAEKKTERKLESESAIPDFGCSLECDPSDRPSPLPGLLQRAGRAGSQEEMVRGSGAVEP